MKLAFWSRAAIVVVVAVVAADPAHAQAPDTACQVTRTQSVANEELSVGVPPNGRILFHPGGPGFVTSDGALGMKFLWNRSVVGKLQVSGKRIDGEAPPLRSEIPDAYGDSGIQPSYLIFPTTGCWEITARVQGKPISMVLLVEQKGAGPNWKRD